MRLRDKVCIITGAANGIGLAGARKFAAEGARVMLCDLDPARTQAAAADIAAGGALAIGYGADVADRASVDAMVGDVLARFGRIDVLVNNAGVTRDARFIKMTEEQFDTVIAVNLKGVFNCTQAVAETMLAQGAGSIINTSSVSGVYGNFGQANYSASKAAVLGMTKTLAREFGPRGVRVNAVIPGSIATSMIATVPADILEKIKGGCWLRRLGSPEELANVYAFLASDEASYVNGASIEVSGGMSF